MGYIQSKLGSYTVFPYYTWTFEEQLQESPPGIPCGYEK